MDPTLRTFTAANSSAGSELRAERDILPVIPRNEIGGAIRVKGSALEAPTPRNGSLS